MTTADPDCKGCGGFGMGDGRGQCGQCFAVPKPCQRCKALEAKLRKLLESPDVFGSDCTSYISTSKLRALLKQ